MFEQHTPIRHSPAGLVWHFNRFVSPTLPSMHQDQYLNFELTGTTFLNFLDVRNFTDKLLFIFMTKCQILRNLKFPPSNRCLSLSSGIRFWIYKIIVKSLPEMNIFTSILWFPRIGTRVFISEKKFTLLSVWVYNLSRASPSRTGPYTFPSEKREWDKKPEFITRENKHWWQTIPVIRAKNRH